VSNQAVGFPLFIVGLPRSGTKLLRGLLNQHPAIGLTRVESRLLPYWYKNWGQFGDLSKKNVFHQFYLNTVGLPYFHIKRLGNDEIISEDHWYESCSSFDVASVYEALIKHDVIFGGNVSIWGDKTPAYISHVNILRELYPNARVLHIVRDARDYVLSSQAAWGKNIFRSAQNWQNSLSKLERDSQKFGSDFLETKFEDILIQPESELTRICHWLGIEFDSEMLTLTAPTERHGDAKGYKAILGTNFNKYEKRLSKGEIRKLESIAHDGLEKYGYETINNSDPIKLSKNAMRYYAMKDGLNLWFFSIRDEGLVVGTKQILNKYLTSGNRV